MNEDVFYDRCGFLFVSLNWASNYYGAPRVFLNQKCEMQHGNRRAHGEGCERKKWIRLITDQQEHLRVFRLFR